MSEDRHGRQPRPRTTTQDNITSSKMTPKDHEEEAKRLLHKVEENEIYLGYAQTLKILAMAQVHATLSLKQLLR